MILVILYVIYLAASLVVSGLIVKRDSKRSGRTRKINPKFGYLGFLGVIGFFGIWTYLASGVIFPFVFFIFFGFFVIDFWNLVDLRSGTVFERISVVSL